jgi:hypothetical protein
MSGERPYLINSLSLVSQMYMRKKVKGAHDLDVDKLLEVQDTSDVKGPGLPFYTQVPGHAYGSALQYLHPSR